ELQPGKLFIVGDPKQSIFAFRRADIEAFHDVTNLVVAQGGRPLSLSTNFRSHETILSAVNGMFSKLMTPIHGIQPAYAPLDALRRYRVPYVADGEKHFYRRQEVIDLANLLRWVQNPDDVVARLGVLRSPMGALTDREIVELMALGADDYRAGGYALLEQHSQAAHLSRLYA